MKNGSGKYSIYSKRVFIDNSFKKASVIIHNDKIDSVVLNSKINESIDFGNKVIMPGVIDCHVHINEPGRSHWEGFETATKAAAKGGITTIVDMPLNSSPVTTTVGSFQQKIESSKNKLFINCGFWAGAINNDHKELKALIDAGCLGVKVFLSHSGIDEFPNISLTDLELLMKNISNLNIPVLAHCELEQDNIEKIPEEDQHSYNAYLNSRPKKWENDAIEKFIDLSKKYQCKAHIVHLASDEAIDMIIKNKETNKLLSVETCPHYILFNAEEIKDGDTLFKCAPPIRDKENGRNLKKAISGGIIDLLSSDHSPCPPELKAIDSGSFTDAWGGIAGLQFLLAASWTALKEEIELEQFIPLLTSKVSKFIGLDNQIGNIAEGYDANITIWEPEENFIVDQGQIEHRHKTTPYNNLKLSGKIDTTIVNGKVVYQNNEIAKSAFGKIYLNKKK